MLISEIQELSEETGYCERHIGGTRYAEELRTVACANTLDNHWMDNLDLWNEFGRESVAVDIYSRILRNMYISAVHNKSFDSHLHAVRNNVFNSA